MFAARSLGNGVKVVLDSSLGVRTVTICVSLEAGTRYDESGRPGFAHLLEHLVLAAPVAGSAAVSLAEWIDSVGGQSNASTTHDAVIFWARVPPAEAVECVRLFDRAFATPAITDSLCDSERRVVVQELLAASGDPVDVAEECLYGNLFGEHPMGRPVGGSASGFPVFTAENVLSVHRRNVETCPVTVALVGPASVIEEAFAVLRCGELGRIVREAEAPRGDLAVAPARRTSRDLVAEADYVYLAAGGVGAARGAALWGAAEVLAAAVGGTPASPLYARLRGEFGASYQLRSTYTAYRDVGVWSVIAGAEPRNIGLVEQVVSDCLEAVAGGRLDADGFAAAKRQAAGSALLDNEHPVALAHLNCTWTTVGADDVSPLTRVCRLIAEVDHDAVRAAAAEILGSYACAVAS